MFVIWLTATYTNMRSSIKHSGLLHSKTTAVHDYKTAGEDLNALWLKIYTNSCLKTLARRGKTPFMGPPPSMAQPYSIYIFKDPLSRLSLKQLF